MSENKKTYKELYLEKYGDGEHSHIYRFAIPMNNIYMTKYKGDDEKVYKDALEQDKTWQELLDVWVGEGIHCNSAQREYFNILARGRKPSKELEEKAFGSTDSDEEDKIEE